MLGHLFGINVQKAYHYFSPPRWKNYFPLFSLLLLGVGLLLLEFLGFQKVFLYLRSLEDFPLFFVRFLLERLIGLIFLISYSMIFMSSMINGLSTFFLSAELPFLFMMPIRKWKILVLKFLENWGTSCYLVVLFLFCFLLSHASTFELGWRHYLISSTLLVVFTLSPVALGSALLVFLVRFFPARRIHQIVTILAGVFLGVLTIALRLMKPERLLNPADTDDFVQLIKDLTLPSFNHLPSSWAAQIVVYNNLRPALFLVGFTLFSMALLVVAMHLFYNKAFVFSQESRSLRAKPAAKRFGVKEKHVSPTVALIRKDSKLFFRDATQWSQLLLLAALVVVYLLNIKNLAIQLPMVRWIVSFINLGLAGFVLSALSVRFLFPSLSMEGRTFWMIKTLPVSIRKLLWCKFMIYFPPFLLFTQALVFFSNRILEVPTFFMALSMLNILAVAFALTGLAIGVGALLPNFKTDNPSQIAIGPGGVLYMLISFIYLTLMLLIQIRPVWFYVIEHTERMHVVLYTTAAVTLTLIVALVPMEWGARRLAAQEYS